MSEEIKWFVGAVLAMGGFVLSLIGLDRRTMSKIEAGDGKLHKRIDGVKDNYVRRAEYSDGVRRFEQSVDKMVEEQRRTNVRIDKMIEVAIRDK